MGKFCFVLFCFLAVHFTAGAQSLYVFHVDASEFPLIKAKFRAFDKDGNSLRNFSPDDFYITEDGIKRAVIKMSCPPVLPPPALSSVLTIDKSGSMGVEQGGISNLELAKTAARAWIEGLPAGQSECALTAFDDYSYFIQDFTTNKNKLIEALEKLRPSDGTDYDQGFLFQVAGGLEVIKKAKNKRVLIFLTDGQPNFRPNEMEIITLANQLQVTIFCVTLGMGMPDILKNIALNTGGEWYENVTTKDQAEETYRKILGVALGEEPCEIQWQSGAVCYARQNPVIEIPVYSMKATASYTMPESLLPLVEILPSGISFKNVVPGSFKDTSITITARNTNIRVKDIISPHSAFTIVDYHGSPPPFTLQKDESRVLTIRYTPQDSSRIVGAFEIKKDLCSDSYAYFSGGFPKYGTQENLLKLTHPNGNEIFVVGTDTAITWKGVTPEDTVQLHYSIDKGENWNLINPKATGLQDKWHVPNTPSDQCLVRVDYKESTDTSRKFEWAINAFGDNKLPYPYLTTTRNIIDKDGNSYMCGFFSGSQTIGNSSLTSYGAKDIYIAKYDPDGKVLWAHQAGSTMNDESKGIAIGKDGDIYICGSYTGSTNFGNGIILANTGLEDMFIAKYDNDGNILWAKNYSSANPESAHSICMDRNENIYIGGTHTGIDFGSGFRLLSRGGLDGFVAKLSSDGNIQWAKSIGSGYIDKINSIACDKNGMLYATGNSESSIGDVIYFEDEFRLTLESTYRNYSAYRFLAKFNEDGSCIWAKTSGSDYLAMDSLSNIYTYGSFACEIDLGNGISLKNEVSPFTSNFLARYDSDGKAIWASIIDAQGQGHNLQLTAIASTSTGNIYICGRLDENAVVDFGHGVKYKSTSGQHLFLANYTGGGIARWVKGMTGSYNASSYSLAIDPQENVYMSGIYERYITFGDINLSGPSTFLAKYSLNDEMDQNDTSDVVFSIVKPLASSQNIDMGRVLISSVKDSLIQSFITNTGSYPIRIDSISITGVNASEFQLVSGIPPFTIPVGEKKSVEFRFRPAAVGGRSADLTVITQADTLRQTIIGEGVKPVIQVAASFIDFGVMEVGSLKDTTVTAVLKNIGDVPLTITATQMLGPDKEQFEIISGGGSFVLNAGSIHEMQLRFAPNYIGRTSGQIGFDYDGMAGRPAVVQLFGQGIGGMAYVVDDSAYIGETHDIKLMLGKVKPASVAQASATSFRATLAFKNSILTPTRQGLLKGAVLKGGIETDTLTITQQWAAQTSELARIPMIATLGDRISTDVELLEFDWLDDAGKSINYDTELQSGIFTVLGICPEGGDRLFDAGGQALMMMVAPNPANGITEITFETVERGSTQIILTDVLGRQQILKSGDFEKGAHTFQFDTENLTSGMYILTMQTPTQIFTQQININK